MMSFERFLDLRRAERDWAHANGFNNDDPARNGALALLAVMSPAIGMFVDVGAGEGVFSRRVADVNPATRLLMFEPNGARIPALRSAFPAADVRALALSDRVQESELFIHERGRDGGERPGAPFDHYYGASLHRRARLLDLEQTRIRPLRVSVRRLDGLQPSLAGEVEGKRLFLRIGVNGHEARVLRGAAAVMVQAKAAGVMFAFSSAWADLGEGLLESLRGLHDQGFGIYRLLPFGIERVRVFVADMERAHYCLYLALRGYGISGAAGWVTTATPYGDAEILAYDDILKCAVAAA